MLFKALNNKEEEKTEHSYIYSHTTKHLNFTVKSKRSQSALEYMMTYGWAILIIVIVAVILYSIGIFNPSSSITTTITGFQKTPVSSAIFTDNGGLSLSVQNSVGYPIKITNITATTLTGGKVTIEPNITLLPGKSQVLVLSKVFTAANQGSHISTAVTITYKEISQQLPGPYISTGSITGSTPTVIYPANYTFAAVSKLTIKNTQSSATPSPFQQMVNITSADNGWQLISNGNFGQNVEFFYSNGTIIPSWLESYTGSNAIWWLKLGSIPAGSSITVYMGIASTSTNLFNTVNDGEAPQIPCGSTPTSSCSNYAEYDDGADVFLAYFNGNTPISNFNYYTTYIQLSQSTASLNGNTINVINDTRVASGSFNVLIPEFILNVAIPNEPLFIESNTYLSATSSADNPRVALLNSTSPTSSLDAIGVNVGWAGAYFQEEDINNGVYTFDQAQQGSESVGWVYSSLLYIPKTSSYYGYTAPQLYSTTGGYSGSTTNTLLSTGSLYIGGIGSPNTAYTLQENAMLFNWVRARAYPPNGVMPSVSFGSVS